MSDVRKSIGAAGEKHAVTFLQEKGFVIKDRNATSRVGEIDIVAHKDDKVIFCEVRTKISEKHGRPSDSLTYFKKKHFTQAIRWYLVKHNLRQYKLSADFISVILHADWSVKEIVHYENVMQLQGFY